MSNLKTFTFGVNRAWVSANGNTANAASWVEIPIVADSSVEYTLQHAEVANGEGKLQITWRFGQRAKVMLRMKQFAFNILERITGSPVSSANGIDQLLVGRSEEINPPNVRLKLVQQAKDSNNTAGYLHVVVFNAQGEMPGVQMKESTPGEFSINFDCLAATFDENGAVIPESYFRVDALKTVST